MSKLLEISVRGNVWLRQFVLLPVIAALSLATANAAEFYVDPVLGDDAFDGSQPKPAGGGSKAGP